MKKILFSLVLGAMALISCNRDDEKASSVPVVASSSVFQVSNLDVRQVDGKTPRNWVYYSFTNNKSVEVSEPSSSSSWDIAFFGTQINTKAGALKTDKKVFNDVSSAPSDGYILDKDVYTFKGHSAIVKQNLSLLSGGYAETFWSKMYEYGVFKDISKEEAAAMKSDLVHNNGFVTFDYTNPPSYTPNNWVYIVKTADGKFVKIQFSGYKNDKNESGYISFQYKIAGGDNKF